MREAMGGAEMPRVAHGPWDWSLVSNGAIHQVASEAGVHYHQLALLLVAVCHRQVHSLQIGLQTRQKTRQGTPDVWAPLFSGSCLASPLVCLMLARAACTVRLRSLCKHPCPVWIWRVPVRARWKPPLGPHCYTDPSPLASERPA